MNIILCMSKIICIILVIGSVFYAGCSLTPAYNLTNDENSSTVKLRNELMDFARGKTKELMGNTQPDEGFVLMYGYMLDNSMENLPLSATLRSKLEDISPPDHDEVYVLAHFQGDEILDYTEWENDGRKFPSHPLLEAPVVIRGNPYKLTLDVNDKGRVIVN
jgi:hypothetical protein